MNSTNFDRILRQVFIVPVLAILLGAAALGWQIHAANDTVRLIEDHNQRITETLNIYRLVVDQETGLRGYQTTGDRRFLEPYRVAEKALPAAFLARRNRILNDARRAEFNQIEEVHETWENGFAEPLIASIAAGTSTNDVDLNLSGKVQMDDLRHRLLQLNKLTEQRRDEAIAHWRAQVRTMTIALVALALLIGLVLGFYIRRLLKAVSGAFRESNNAIRLRAEQTFRSEQRLRTTLQSIGDGVITCDAQGHVQTMNPVAQQLTGWVEADARNLPLEQVFSIIDETTREPLENPVEKVKRLNAVVGLANHSILIRKDGTEMFIDDSAAPIRDKHINLVGVVLVFRDITLEKKSREALLANEKLAVAGRLAATIAHEIHNPLDSVSNLLFLMDGRCSPEEHSQFLELAKGEIARVTQISRAMLSLYRESKAPVEIDLKDMLESILLLMDRRFVALGVTVEHNLADGLIIHGFPAELRQVFTNLLTNAAEASGKGGTVELKATHVATPGPGVLVEVEDSGPGVPEAIRANLFKPFFTTKGERGTGLGLWVSQGIVTKHGGRIELASSTDPTDHGTTVSVFLATDPVINLHGE